ncbi:MAG: VIT family protein [Chitinophagaceae bacterium]|nr:MAG: VIT family protein [Chitinophagaceae bacterium]
MELEKHYTTRSGWLRATVLGSNDGIISTTSLALGVAAAKGDRQSIVLAALAGVVAGALSMAAGEYVSVSSQADLENADLERERRELEVMPEIELKELAKIYEQRGVSSAVALEVATQLTVFDALGAHAKDELGINEITQAKPLQAALASCGAFVAGGILPLLLALFAPLKNIEIWLYIFAIMFLALSAIVAAKAGGSPVIKAMVRICFWSSMAMWITALVGYLFGVRTV